MKKQDIDDHNAVAVEVMPDGRIITAYAGGHNINNKMYIRISKKPESIEEFENEIVIDAGATTTYAQLFYKNGFFWLFFRTADKNWSFTKSSDGINWSTPKTIISSDVKYYIKIMDTTDSNILRLVMYANVNYADTNIRLAFLNCSTGDITNANGALLDNINTMVSPISKDSISIIIPNESGKKQRLLDVAISSPLKTIIAYAPYATTSDGEYKVSYYENEVLRSVSIVACGKPFYGASHYFGGAVFDANPNIVYLSRETSGTWYIERYATTDEVSFAKTGDITQVADNNIAARPFVTKNGGKLFWQQGYYNYSSISDFQTDLKYYNSD